MTFKNVLSKTAKEYGVLLPEDVGGQGADVGGGAGVADQAAPLPTNDLDSAPTPAEGSDTQEPEYNKPYKRLAQIAYDALQFNPQDISPAGVRKLEIEFADEIKDDRQATAILDTIENILNETGPEVNPDSFGPGGGL